VKCDNERKLLSGALMKFLSIVFLVASISFSAFADNLYQVTFRIENESTQNFIMVPNNSSPGEGTCSVKGDYEILCVANIEGILNRTVTFTILGGNPPRPLPVQGPMLVVNKQKYAVPGGDFSIRYEENPAKLVLELAQTKWKKEAEDVVITVSDE
jgi:hypothetical protein